jgi:hypothetical protein
MVRLHDIVELFGLADGDSRPVLRVGTLDRRFVRRPPVNGNRLGDPAVPANRLRQKPFGSVLIPLLRQQKVNGLPLRIDGSVPRCPRPFDFDIGFVQPPPRPHGALAPGAGLGSQRAILAHPPVERRVRELHPAFFHACFALACAEGGR